MTITGKRRGRFHAFLSFRGSDTRDGFVGHLYEGLKSKGIYAFKDDLRLEKGRSISLEIVEAIKDSSLYVVILSENYASSSWCLDELVEILDCCEEASRSGSGSAIIPVFYKVDTSDVENLRGSFGAALKEHESNFEEEKVRRWGEALTKVAGICGWDSRNRDEATFIADIVRDVSDKVNFASSFDANDLVGMGYHVEKMLKLLCVESNAVRIVGIWGMGGMGKSTIARVIYDQLYPKFGACWFFENVGVKFKVDGAAALKRELLSNILKEKDLTGWPLDRDSNIIKERLSELNVLIVLDGVDDLEQLQVLAKDPNWFGRGSRIIITTREKQLLALHRVKFVYEAMPLEIDASLQLFSQYAFKQNQPKDDYLELSLDFIFYAGGIPLALKVLGSSLYNGTIIKWQSELDKLRRLPSRDILKVLKVSYDGLEDTDKDVFLDIACFFNGMKKDKVRNILDGCGFFSDRAFDILQDKALLSISNDKLSMHELLRQMGQDIVRQECKDPGQRSRWWDPDDIYNCLTKEVGTKKVEGIFLDMSESREMCLSCKAFENMTSLRLLKFCSSLTQCVGHACNVQLPGECLHSLSDQLRYLHWDAFPAKEFPSNFSPEYLVDLHLPYSKVSQLWKGKQRLVNLKSVDLSHSDLTIIPDLSEAQKLESLNLQNCKKLVDVSSIEYLSKLKYLNLSGCTSLVGLPSMKSLELLTTLDLSKCSNLQELHQLSRSTKYIYLSGTAIQELPPSIEDLSGLLVLDLRNCTNLVNIQNSSKLKCLGNLDIAGCSNLLVLSSRNQYGKSTNISCPVYSASHVSDSSLSNAMISDGLNYAGQLDEVKSLDLVSEHQSGRVEEVGEYALAVGRQNHDELKGEDEDTNKGGGGKEAVNAEEKKRKRLCPENELNDSECKHLIELETPDKHVEKSVGQLFPFDDSSASLCNHKSGVESAHSLLSMTTISSFSTNNHSEFPPGSQRNLQGSSCLNSCISNCSARSLPGGDLTIDRSEEARLLREVGNKEPILKAFRDLQSMLDQGPEKVGRNMEAFLANLHFLKNSTKEAGISSEENSRLSNIEEKASLIVGQVLGANYGKKEIESMIQTYHQQSAKCRHLIAEKEEADKVLKSTTSKIHELRSRMANLQEQLASAEKRQNDATQNRDSLTTALRPLVARLQNLRDADLERQRFLIERSELAARRNWEDLKASTCQSYLNNLLQGQIGEEGASNQS